MNSIYFILSSIITGNNRKVCVETKRHSTRNRPHIHTDTHIHTEDPERQTERKQQEYQDKSMRATTVEERSSIK